MCDEGRYGWKHVHSAVRLVEPRRRGTNGYANVEWSALVADIDASLRKAGRLAAVLSPHLTVEEAYLLATYVRSIDPDATLALGPVPTVGEDEKYPGNFVIHAEKCPNRRGVETIVARLGGSVLGWDAFLAQVESDPPAAVWISGGYPAAWHDEAAAEKFAGVPTLVVQDCFASPLWERAEHQLPGATFAEREGSYVNFNDILQSFRWAIRPPAGVITEGQLYWQLHKRSGLYNAKAVLAEIAREIAFFAAAGAGVPSTGVDLKINQLAAAEATSPAAAATV
jgi:NADH-quinone oxidoreductase subunit G